MNLTPDIRSPVSLGSRFLTLSTCHQGMENSDLISGCHSKTAIGPKAMERGREREKQRGRERERLREAESERLRERERD